MDKAHRAIALARVEEWVRARLLGSPAHLALDLAAIAGVNHTAIDLDSFLRIKIVVTIFISSITIFFRIRYSVTLLDW